MEKQMSLTAFVSYVFSYITYVLSLPISRLQKAKLLWSFARALGGGGSQSVIGILIGMLIMMFVGIVVIVALVGSVTPDSTWSDAANTTWASLQSNTWLALGLVVIIPIVIGAVAIMRVLRGGGLG